MHTTRHKRQIEQAMQGLRYIKGTAALGLSINSNDITQLIAYSDIEDYQYGKDLYLPLGEKLEAIKDDEWKLLVRKAMSVVRLSLSRNVAHHTIKTKTTKEMKATLSSMYEKPSTSNKVHLMRSMFNLQMRESAAVANKLSKLNKTITKLYSVKIKFDDEVQALILLFSLSKSLSGAVIALNASVEKEKLQFDDVRDLIISEEIRRKESGSASGSVLNAGNRGRLDSRSKGNHGRSKSKGNLTRTRAKSSAGIVMRMNECKATKDKSVNSSSDAHGDVMIVSDSTTETATEALVLSVSNSRVSFHSCSSTDLMEHYTFGNFGKVYLDNDEPLKIVGKGDLGSSQQTGL
ncbi:hypothetical protein V2J09_006792 [Rumex salicifolius]